jgi:2',3'-cyclic-nucleotide 2'-phosphodiesterase/3'-nucleotidase
VVLANVYSVKTNKPLFAPYRIIEKRVRRGRRRAPGRGDVKVGIIGFTRRPSCLGQALAGGEGLHRRAWSKRPKRYMPEMRAKGADVVVAISHGGLDASPYSPAMENGNYYLAQVPGIDALLLGHSHQLFPNPASTVAQFNLPQVDKVKGRVFGVPTVMANLWGKNLGVVRLQLRHDGKRWTIDQDAAVVETRSDPAGRQALCGGRSGRAGPGARRARGDHPLREDADRQHRLPHVDLFRRRRRRLGDPGRQPGPGGLRARATWRRTCRSTRSCRCCRCRRRSRAARPAWRLHRRPAGSLALNNAADLYLYPNALYAVKVDGAGLKAWLEKAARRFNTIDPAKTEPQELVNTRFCRATTSTRDLAGAQLRDRRDAAAGQRIRKLRCAARRWRRPGIPRRDE